jgi:hypothetical protein
MAMGSMMKFTTAGDWALDPEFVEWDLKFRIWTSDFRNNKTKARLF